MIRRLIRTGMDCARLNFSHGTHEEHLLVINNVRSASQELKKHVGIIQDLPGPKFRIGKLNNDPIQLKKNSKITLITDSEDSDDDTRIPLRQHNLPKYVTKGATIFLSDGTIKLRVTGTARTEIQCVVLVGGPLYSGKGVNIPSLGKDFETFTDADKDHALFGLENGVDFIAVSFVRNEKDIKTVKSFIAQNWKKGKVNGWDEPPWVIAKIEKRDALKDLDGIIDVSDAVMVARGDLGVENPIERVPIIQKRIISLCNSRAVPVITATQMLESMVQNPSPTRAEVTDVANAILDGTDAVMLSEETAVGKYPLECVQVLHSVAINAEERMIREEGFRRELNFESRSDADETSYAAITISQNVGAKILITPTETGKVASSLSRFKPRAPVVALTSKDSVARKLKLVWGVRSLMVDPNRTHERGEENDGDKRASSGSRRLDEIIETSIIALGKEDLVSDGDKLVVFCDSVEFFGQEGNLVFITEAKKRTRSATPS